MKKKMPIVVMLVVVSLTFCSCFATRDSVKIDKVVIGMTQNDVQHLLGTPLFKNAEEGVEEWGYRKVVGQVIDPEEMLFIVTFDENGRVASYNSVKTPPRH